MAEKKTTTKTTKTTRSNSVWGLNKICFYVIGAMAILYLIATVLSFLDINTKIIPALQGIATACAISIVAWLAWHYVKNASTVLKVLYIVFVLVVIVGIIIPMI